MNGVELLGVALVGAAFFGLVALLVLRRDAATRTERKADAVRAALARAAQRGERAAKDEGLKQPKNSDSSGTADPDRG